MYPFKNKINDFINVEINGIFYTVYATYNNDRTVTLKFIFAYPFEEELLELRLLDLIVPKHVSQIHVSVYDT